MDTCEAEVSCLIPFRNRRRYLRQSVESVLAEQLPSLEIIGIDDGSEDGSAESISDLPMKVFRIEPGGNVARARNRALELARGKFITFLDSDDILVPNGIRWRLDYLRAHPSVNAVRGFHEFVDENGKALGISGFKSPTDQVTYESIKKDPDPIYSLPLHLFRKEMLKKVAPFDEKLLGAEDVDFIFRFLQISPIAFVDKQVFNYRLHDRNGFVQRRGKKINYSARAHAETVMLKLEHGVISEQAWENFRR